MRDTAAGLLIGAAGGLAFWLLGIPAPWLAGAMMAAIAAVFSHVKIGMPDWLRAVAFIFLGIQTGTAVSWETVGRAIHWPVSIAFLCLTAGTAPMSILIPANVVLGVMIGCRFSHFTFAEFRAALAEGFPGLIIALAIAMAGAAATAYVLKRMGAYGGSRV